ncbi:MAG TPA: STAS/SEC14 domain-containing protein [Rhizomicrobium sp.]|nr:STAS/SEC14 domain-containing protein [Rhizomicrobium sp.]
MMEILASGSPDIFAAIWHDPLSIHDVRARMTQAERDRLAGRHDVRLMARYKRGAKPVTAREIMEDATLGAGQWRDFERIAIITDDVLIRHAVQFFAPFFHGPVRVFSNANVEGARRWLQHHDLQ